MAIYETFQSVTGQELEKALWPVEKPKAVVQLVHGMAEHSARYADFGSFLAETASRCS